MAKNILIIGASRGLGLGLAKAFHSQGWSVTATVRNPDPAGELQALGITVETLEMTDPHSLDRLAQRLAGSTFEVLFVNAGIAGPQHHDPRQANADEMGQLFMTNAVAPIQVAERLLPLVKAEDGLIVFMSSILGSVEIGPGMGMPLYGASKAALNHLARHFAKGLDQERPGVLLMHPGWVRTDMGGAEAPLDVETSCRGMVEQVSAALGNGGLRYLDWQGKPLPW